MKFLQRTVYQQLKDHQNKPEISVILGPRQAGKTTIMLKLKEELESDSKPTAYFNLDIIEDKQYFTSQHNLLNQITHPQTTIFIDEIHRLENAGLFLKGLYDLKTGHKLIVSGSGSLELKANIIEPMTGRKKVFYCLPLSFTEFRANKIESGNSNPYQRQRLVDEYLNYGGYPQVILATTHQDKIDSLTEIYKSYIQRDIQLLLGVKKEQAFSNLVKILASQTGNLIKRSELASVIGVGVDTIKKYLYLLEKTFVISLVKPFYANARHELTKAPKVYFNDLGLLRLAQGTWPTLTLQKPILGGFFENACWLRLQELELLQPPRFWRSSSGAEVDFVITSPIDGQPIPVEVKLASRGKGTLGKSLISFISKYHPKNAYIYTLDLEEEAERLGAKIKYLPYYQEVKLQ